GFDAARRHHHGARLRFAGEAGLDDSADRRIEDHVECVAMRILATLVLLLCSVTAGYAQSIQGRWRLLSAEDVRADGTVAQYPWGRKPIGAIVVEGGYCYVQIMSGDVPTFVESKPIGQQMTAALLSTYIAYSGACTIDEKQ